MQIASATNGKNLEAKIAFHFGRAENYLIYDIKTKKFKVHQNPEFFGKEELPPDLLNRFGVNVVIAFSLGPKAFDKFKQYGIKLYKAIEKNILENIKAFERGELRQLEKQDIY